MNVDYVRKLYLEEMQGENECDINMKLLNSDNFKERKIHFCNENEMGIMEAIGVSKIFPVIK